MQKQSDVQVWILRLESVATLNDLEHLSSSTLDGMLIKCIAGYCGSLFFIFQPYFFLIDPL